MNSVKIAIIGLGYVGLPLAHAFAHDQFKILVQSDYASISTDTPVIIDVKGIVPNATWRL